jgi:hypothetical protein
MCSSLPLQQRIRPKLCLQFFADKLLVWSRATRVTRLADFSPIRRLLTLKSFFSSVDVAYYFWQNIGWATFWAFFTTSSGRLTFNGNPPGQVVLVTETVFTSFANELAYLGRAWQVPSIVLFYEPEASFTCIQLYLFHPLGAEASF